MILTNIVLDFFLLNVPEGIIYSLILLKGESISENKIKYAYSSILFSVLVFLIPLIEHSWYPILIPFAISVVGKAITKKDTKKVFKRSLFGFLLIVVIEIAIMGMIVTYYGVENYLLLPIAHRFSLLFIPKVLEAVVAYRVNKIN